jgi:hypothetical protein
VTERENSGAGFFTTIALADPAPQVSSPEVLGYETHAHVERMEHGLGFVLFMKDGILSLLEGYALAGSTLTLDLTDLTFEVFRVARNALSLRHRSALRDGSVQASAFHPIGASMSNV